MHRTRMYCLVALVLSAIVGALTIQTSMMVGRLALPPLYDDSAFLLDAARRMRTIYEPSNDGLVPRIARQFWTAPPKSMYNTPLAMAAYAVFGLKDWAPYIPHVASLFLLLLLIAQASRESPSRASLWMAPAAFTSLGTMMVFEFRPDCMAGVLIVWGAWLAANTPLASWSAARSAGIGSLFAAAALAKPHAAPAALGFLGLVVGHSCLAQLGRETHSQREAGAPRPWRTGMREAIRVGAWRAGLAISVGTLLVLPYAITQGREVYLYIRENMYGSFAQTWIAKSGDDGTLWWSLGYYLWGAGGSPALGPGLFALLALAVAGVAIAWAKGSRDERREVTIVAVACLAGYTIATIAPLKHRVFGMPFFMLLILSATLGLRTLLTLARPAALTRTLRWLVPTASTIAVALTFQLPTGMSGWDPTHARSVNDTFERLAKAIHDAVDRKPAHVVVACSGTINAEALEWFTLRERLAYRFTGFSHQRRVQDCMPFLVNQADIVVVASEGHPWSENALPVNTIQGPLRTALDANRRFELVAQVTPLGLRSPLYVYRKKPLNAGP